jgi:hypothetical protein
VLTVLAIALDDYGVGVLFRCHDGNVAPVAQKLQQCLVGDDIELLHRLALDIRFARHANDAGQTRAPHLRRDNLRGQGNAREQPRELSACLRVVAALLLKNVLLDREQLQMGFTHPRQFRVSSPKLQVPTKEAEAET